MTGSEVTGDEVRVDLRITETHPSCSVDVMATAPAVLYAANTIEIDSDNQGRLFISLLDATTTVLDQSSVGVHTTKHCINPTVRVGNFVCANN